MRKESRQLGLCTKAKTMVRKISLVLTLAVALSIVTSEGFHPNSYVNVEAAEKTTLTSIKPTFTVEKRSGKNATLAIKKVKGATYYKVYRKSTSEKSYQYIGKTTTLKFNDSGLKATESYEYKIKACNSNSCSKYSSKVTVKATLSKVTNLKSKCSTNGVTLTWSKVDGASMYKVYRSTSKDGAFNYIGSSKYAMYTDKTAESGTTYYYRVRGMKAESGITYNGVYSSKLTVKCSWNQTGSNSSTGSNNSNQTTDNTDSYIAEVLRLVNIERVNEGLSELKTTTELNKAAHIRALETKTLFSHTRPDGSSCFTALDECNVSYNTAGENIAYGQKTPKDVVTAWMNSEGHRANILSSKFGKIGIGCYYSNGTYYWTQMFTN